MNKEKLIGIIQKDLDELKELSEEIKKDIPYAYLEVDIALSKARLVAQEFQLLKDKYIPAPEVKPEIIDEEIPAPEVAEPVFERQEPVMEELIEEPQMEIPMGLIELENDQEEFVEEEEDYPIEEEEPTFQVKQVAPPKMSMQYEGEDEDMDDELPEEEEEERIAPPLEKKRVADNFQHEKSINDTVVAETKVEEKVGHAPIGSLQASISINDRFLFIREIFDNNAARYNETIRQLDNMTDIKEAVDYLSKNFKIKKTETSLKFVDFIKRRFAK